MADKKFRPTDSRQDVRAGQEGTYSFGCDCGFASYNWPTKKAAQERAQQHKQEHLTGDLMEDIDEFLAKHTKGDR